MQESITDLRRGWQLAALAGLLGLGVFVYQWWTRPPAVEFDNLRYIQLLWTAVSSRNEEWLGKVASVVEQRHADGEMSASELAHFQAVITTAESGQWEAAARECYDFAAAQQYRRRTRPATEHHDH